MYPWLVFIHAVSALVSIGPFIVLIPLLSKLRTADGILLQSHLDTFHFVVRLSKHAGHVLVFSGLFLLWLGGWPWTTPWIAGTFGVLIASLVFMARAFSPTIRRIRKADTSGERKPLIRKLSRSLYIYLIILFIMLWLMIMKPALW